MSIARNIADRRRSLGWTQTELERASGLTQAQISRIEADKTENITLISLRKLARAFGCSVVDLLTDEDRRPARARPDATTKADGLTLEGLARRVGELEQRLNREGS